MNKPSREDILRDLSSYVDGWWNPQVYLEAVYKKGRYTPEDFWNPQFDEQWNFIEETTEEVPETVEETTDEWNNNWWLAPKEQLTEDNANNYQRLNDYVKRYNELVRSKEEILNRYNWWEWYTPWTEVYNSFKKEIDNINSQLKDMENSDELASLLQSIKDNWLWAKWYESESFARNWLADIINWVWSSFEFNTWKNDANFMWQAPVKANFKSMDKLIDTYLWNHKPNNSSDKLDNNTDKKSDNKKSSNNKKNNVDIWKPWSNWLPDNYSSINWVEEEKDDNLIYDKNWNPVWTKVKNNKKKDDKKKIEKVSKSSPTILNLIKGKK